MGDAVADGVAVAVVVVVAGVSSAAVYAVDVHRDRFYRAGSVRSVDEARAFGPQIAGGCWTVIAVVVHRRRWPLVSFRRPWYLGQLGAADEILVRPIGTRR